VTMTVAELIPIANVGVEGGRIIDIINRLNSPLTVSVISD
jgi:hypothetical protein